MNSIKQKVLHLDCIVNHEGFNPVCLDKNVLWAALANLVDREGCVIPPKDNIPNRYIQVFTFKSENCNFAIHKTTLFMLLSLFLRTYRYASYRQFTWWIHDRLGCHVRRVMQSCAISRIRVEFEEDAGNYSVFEGDDKVASKITKAIAWHDLHQDD